MYIYIHIYIYIYIRCEVNVRYPVFTKVQSGKMGPAPGRFELSKGTCCSERKQ